MNGWPCLITKGYYNENWEFQRTEKLGVKKSGTFLKNIEDTCSRRCILNQKGQNSMLHFRREQPIALGWLGPQNFGHIQMGRASGKEPSELADVVCSHHPGDKVTWTKRPVAPTPAAIHAKRDPWPSSWTAREKTWIVAWTWTTVALWRVVLCQWFWCRCTFWIFCDIPNIGGIPKVVAEVVKLQLSENMKVLMAFGWPAGWQLYWSCFAPETPLALWAILS